MEVPLLLGAINRLPSSWEECFHQQTSLLHGGGAFTSRFPSSWEEGPGVEEKNTVTTYF